MTLTPKPAASEKAKAHNESPHGHPVQGLEDAEALGLSLAQAMRYVANWTGKRVLIKFGGAAMAAGDLGTLLEDVAALQRAGVLPILVHGGGPEISERLAERGVEPRFVDGLRVTDAATMEVVEDVLAGSANRRLVELLQNAGGTARGLSGHGSSQDEGTLFVEPHPNRELGFVGRVTRVDPAPIEALLEEGVVPVFAPLGRGPDGHAYNVNADTAAAALAAALGAEKFLLLTDVRGVYRKVALGKNPSPSADRADRSGVEEESTVLISELTPEGAARLIEEGIISKGMIPKVEACLGAVAAGVPRAHILAASLPHGLLVELFTQAGIGTMITDRSRWPTGLHRGPGGSTQETP